MIAQTPSVLIVGAGAMGMAAGYHLSLAGVAVTFFVRSQRLAQLQPPQRLYCYDDATLKEFRDYRAIAMMPEVAQQSFDYVLVTLDGAACRSGEGIALLQSLADAIRPTPALMMIGGVGVGLREHFLRTTGLPDDRLLHAVLGVLSHQVAAAHLPIHPPTNAELLSQASIAYRHFPNRVGLSVAAPIAAQARRFAGIYNRCTVSRCSVMGMTLYDIMGNVFFPLTAACELAGWPTTDALAANQALWSLCCKAFDEIIGLPQHGWIGKLLRLLMSPARYLKVLRKLERDALPLDFHQFNRFHHGGKVRAQDVQVMRNCLQSGESQGWQMPALRELLGRLHA